MKTQIIKRAILALLMAVTAATASAYDFVVNGIYYNKLSDGNVRVTYKDPNYNSYSGSVTIPSQVTYKGTTYSVTSIDSYAFKGCTGLTSVTIPNSVTSIWEGAFYNCSGLTSVTIPNSVTYISWHTFNGCSGLKSVTIPNSVTEIDRYAFGGCRDLTSVTIPNSVTYIGEGAFGGCSGLTSVTIPNSVTWIDESAFCYCSGLTSVTISNSVTSIRKHTFSGCTGLTSVTIPNSVTSIGEGAFYGCSSLASVTIPNSVTSIGNYAFQECSGLTSITIPNSVTSISNYAFQECSSLASVTIPNSVTSIGYCAFRDCTNLTSITIGNSVTSIGEGAFYGCSSLASVTIPNSVTKIGNYAFQECSGLTSITIPNSVTKIGTEAFRGCYGLEEIVVDNGNVDYDSRDNCNAIIETATNTLIAGCKTTIIPNSVKSIGEGAFYGCSSLASVTIPNSVTSIGNEAFSGCTGLIKSAYPDNFSNPFPAGTAISYPADGIIEYDGTIYNNDKTKLFFAPLGITEITIPNSVTSIGESAFYNCSGLTSVTYNAKNCQVPKGWLSFATNITFFEIGVGVEIIPDNLCQNMKGLTSVTIPNTVTSIGNYAFRDCTGLTSVTIPNSVTSIGSYAFYGCGLVKVIWLPNTPPSGCSNVAAKVHYVANEQYNLSNQIMYKFLSSIFTVDGTVYVPVSPQDRTCDVIDCSYLPDYKSVVISEKVNYKGIDISIIDIKPYSFYNNYNIESVEISNTGNVEDHAFYGCTALQSATISNTGNVGDHAFYGCTALQSATISNTGNVGDLAFYGCSKLQSVNIGDQVTAIGKWAFSGCSAMEYISLGSKVVRIGEEAFSDCSGLTSFTSNVAVPPTCGDQALDDINKWKCTLYVPAECIEQYKVADHWKDFFFIEELGIEDIVVDDDNADCTVEVYSIQGVKVGDSTDGLAPGTYIVKQGRSVTKQVIQ